MNQRRSLFALLMATVMMAVCPDRVWAEVTPQEGELALGKNTLTIDYSEDVAYTFKPKQDGIYVIYSVNETGDIDFEDFESEDEETEFVYETSDDCACEALGLSTNIRDLYAKAVMQANTQYTLTFTNLSHASSSYTLYVVRQGDIIPLLPEMYTIDCHDLFDLSDIRRTDDGTDARKAEYTASVVMTDVPLRDSSPYKPWFVDDEEDCETTSPAKNQLTISLTNDAGTATYHITVVKGVSIYIDSQGGRGEYYIEGDGETDHYGEWIIAKGSDITLTAVPLASRPDCSFRQWTVIDDNTGEILEQYTQSPTIKLKKVTRPLHLSALFSSSESVLIEANKTSEGKMKITAGEAQNSYSLECAKGSTVTFNFSPAQTAEGEEATFDGWFIEGQEDEGPVSTSMPFEMKADDDVRIYAQYSRQVPVTNGWTSYCDGYYDYRVVGGTAYSASYVDAVGNRQPAVRLKSLNQTIYKQEGVLICSDQESVTIKYSYEYRDATPAYDNEMWGNLGGWYTYQYDNAVYQYFSDSELKKDYTYYGLYNKEEPVEFRLYTGGTLPRHKAVLMVGEEEDLARLGIIFDDDDQTGLHTLAADQKRTEQIYDLLGRKQHNTGKGLLVKDGKVIMQK